MAMLTAVETKRMGKKLHFSVTECDMFAVLGGVFTAINQQQA